MIILKPVYSKELPFSTLHLYLLQGRASDFSMSSLPSASSTSTAAASHRLDAGKRDFSNPMFEAMAEDGTAASTSASSAVLAPSSVTHAASPKLRHKEVTPSAMDTGKDTQCLVEEDDSEC